MPTPVFNVFDASGNLVMSLANRLGKVLGVRSEASSGSVSVPAAAIGTPFVYAPITSTSDGFPSSFARGSDAAASFSGTTLHWSVGGMAEGLQLVYGVF